MQYFISTREDVNTSAIELAQVKRMKIFDSLNVPSKIIEIEKNDFVEEVQNKLNTQGRVINIFQYFQNLPEKRIIDAQRLLDQILDQDGLTVKDNTAFLGEKAVVKANLYQDRLYYVDYLDQYGFTVKREFYRYNQLDYTEYFDDQAHLMIREFVNEQGQAIIKEYFCQSNQNTALLTLIELNDTGKKLRFDRLADFQAYFLDKIAANDPDCVFYCDRCTQVLPAIEKMKRDVKSFVVLHSALTPSGDLTEPIYSVYEPIKILLNNDRVKGIISSTKKEAADVSSIFDTNASYAIPVTFVKTQSPVPFNHRKVNQIIAVARIDAIKQLGHLINSVVKLHEKYKNICLVIYGNNTDQKEAAALNKLVAEKNASSYVDFCGFTDNLDAIYETAQLEVLTSKNEGFAMAVIEAQSHGCPVVSYDINYGPAEIIEDGKTGMLVPADDQRELYEKIDNLLSNPQQLALMSSAAYEHAKLFDFEHLKNKWKSFLKEQTAG